MVRWGKMVWQCETDISKGIFPLDQDLCHL
jgi:hypothetical protein